MNVFILAAILIAIAVVGMAIGILMKKDGEFPELHIGKNEEMKKRGITCATSQDKLARQSKD